MFMIIYDYIIYTYIYIYLAMFEGLLEIFSYFSIFSHFVESWMVFQFDFYLPFFREWLLQCCWKGFLKLVHSPLTALRSLPQDELEIFLRRHGGGSEVFAQAEIVSGDVFVSSFDWPGVPSDPQGPDWFILGQLQPTR